MRHDRLVVLDHNHRLARVDESVKQAEQLLHVGEVEAAGRLVKDIDGALLRHLGGQLEPLPLAPGQCRQRLAEGDVAEPDIGEPFEDRMRGRRVRLAGCEERHGFRHRHGEHLADVLGAELVLQDRCVVSLPVALITCGGDAGHHRQVGVDHPGAVAVGTGAFGVGAEQRRLHAVGLRERLAHRLQQPGVGGWVAPPRATDRRLVDRHHAIAPRHRTADERALPRPGHAGQHHQDAERDVDIDVTEVVRVGAAHLHHSGRCPHRRLQRGPVIEVAPGDGAARSQPVESALEDNLPAGRPGTRAKIDHVVTDRDHLRLVLHDEHGVALVAQAQKQAVHPLDVVGVQADRRLVEDVRHVRERRPEVADHLGAL